MTGAARRRASSRLAVVSAAALALLLLLAHAAGARVVGILFDDSGSMAPRINLPTFGAQLLVSTLDGRNGKDRLFTIQLSHALAVMGKDVPPGGVNADNVAQWVSQKSPRLPYTEQALTTTDQHQATLHDIETQWPVAQGSTPYEPLEIILDRLTSEVQRGEEAVLVVITDGDFNTVPDPASIDASFGRYKERLAAKQASLRVEFLLIAPSDAATVAAVKRQGVRAALLTIFNGGESVGSYEVTNLAQLTESLKNVIADVAGTDREKQRRYLTISGNDLIIDTPLSITRLVSVSTEVDPRPVPRLQTRPPNAVDVRHLESAMRAADTAEAIRGQRLRGFTDQMRFQPALEPGNHVLSYDHPVGDNVFLLFETSAIVSLRILRPDGTEAPREGGTYVLTRNSPYTLEAWLTDTVNNAPTRVPLGALRGRTDFAATVEAPPTSRLVALTLDTAANRASAPLAFSEIGTGSVRAQVRLEGLVSAVTGASPIRIIDAAVTFRTDIHPAEACPNCAPDELRATLGTNQTQRSVAAIEITPNAPTAGTATLDLSGVPGALSLVRPDRSVAHDKDEVPIRDGVPLRFDLRMNQSGGKVMERLPFAIRVLPKSPLEGEGKAAATVVPNVPQARLRYTGHTGGGPETPFELTGGNLRTNARANAFVLDFALEDALIQPTADEFTVSWDNALLGGSAKVDGYAVHLAPRTGWWCGCLLYFEDPRNTVTIYYASNSTPQTAQASAPFDVTPSWPELLWSCGEILALLLLLIWLLLGLLNIMRTRRFPRGSVSEVTEGRQLPRHLDLRHRNFTCFRSMLPWRAWLLRPPHERTSVESLLFEAAPGGADLLLAHSSHEFMVIRLGQTATEMLESNPRLQGVKIIWNDEIERSVGAKITIRLLRTLGDHLV